MDESGLPAQAPIVAELHLGAVTADGRKLLELPLTEIGRLYGGRDHSTVLYSIRKVERRMELDSAFRERVRDAIRELNEAS